MTNYDVDARERQERFERFEHAINCMDISPVSMMAFERIAKEYKVSLTSLLQTMLLNALDKELSKNNPQLEFPFLESNYG
ncbi:uncharacterized protein METZ01_LOCUS313766 [marine metagenome]|uniref:Uncharacterized protein n=1 Tax=marine metagenome TaxID=408172 RepID=A0A382NMH5_9ZZZZ